MPSSRHARMTRTAISPRLAIRTLENTGLCLLAVPGDPARRALAGTRFADGPWVGEDRALEPPARPPPRRAGAGGRGGGVWRPPPPPSPAGRGRQGRTWEAPRGASLLVTVL